MSEMVKNTMFLAGARRPEATFTSGQAGNITYCYTK